MAVSCHGLLSQNSPNNIYVSKVRILFGFAFSPFFKCQRVQREWLDLNCSVVGHRLQAHILVLCFEAATKQSVVD